MPTRLLLEGPNIESLLAQVREEHGSAARILSADKVRTGGFAGFFARQRFELAVEIDETIGDDQPTAEVERRNGQDRRTAGAHRAPDSVEALVDLAESQESLFSHALAARRAEKTPPPGPAALGAAGAATVAPARSAAGQAVADAPAALPSTEGMAFAEVLAGLQTGLAGAQPPSAPSVRPFRPATVAADRPDPGPAVNGQPAGLPPPLEAALIALGLPEPWARRATGSDPYAAVVRALGMLPAPPAPPKRPGEVLVIAGELAGAVRLARVAAARMRIDPAKVLVAGPTLVGTGVHASRQLSGPVEAERRVERLRRDDVPNVVVVDAPVDGESAEWARSVIEALAPTAVWALVDATRKTADTARHLTGLGPIDGIAVHATAATADPASVLGLGVPVALLDGRRATPQAWAALLFDRLDQAAP